MMVTVSSDEVLGEKEEEIPTLDQPWKLRSAECIEIRLS